MAEAIINLSFDIEEKIKTNKNLVLKKAFFDYYDRVYKFFIYRTNNEDISEELTSIVFEKLVVNIDKYDSKKSPFSSWIFTIARNSMYDYFRKNGRFIRTSIDEYEDILESDENIENKISSRETNSELLKVLENLDDRERNIISYKFGAGLQNVEIAEIMNLSPTNVGSILYRSMKKLKELLEEDKNE